MTAEQLEELLGKVTQGDCWKCDGTGLAYDPADHDVYEGYKLADKKPCPLCSHGRENASETLRKLAPSLARKVIAAEKLVEAGSELQRLWAIGSGGRDLSWRIALEQAMEEHAFALAAYREASK